jgi:hypothetical protein
VGLVSGVSPTTQTWDKQPCLLMPDPMARRPSPLPVYTHLRAFIFALISFRRSGSGSQLPPYVAGSLGCVLGPLYGFS